MSRHPAQAFRSLPLAALLLACCAHAPNAPAAAQPPRAVLGQLDLGFRVPLVWPSSAGETHALFRVEEDGLAAPWLRLRFLDDACVEGVWSGSPLTLCASPLDGKGKQYGGEQVRWSGPTGDLIIETSPDGSSMRVDGQLFLGDDEAYRALDPTSRLALHPAFYGQVHVTLPFRLGPEWDLLREEPILYAVAAVTVGLSADPPVAPMFQSLSGD